MRMHLSLKSFYAPVLFLAAFAMLFHGGYAMAQLWVQYDADSGIFSSKAPEEYETKVGEFLVDDNRSISSEEMSALIDQRPFKNVIKGYIVRADQTIGGGMNTKQIDLLLQRELDLYEDFYLAHGGTIRSRHSDGVLSYPGGELVIAYDDPEFGTQIVKVRVLFSTSTRLEQILIAPLESINSMMNRDFFDSLTFADGLKVTEQTLKMVWDQKESPLGIFTVNMPPITDPYFPFPPKIQNSKDAEIISMLFRDPVRNESMYYNIYGYKFDRFINEVDIQNVMMKNHVLKYKADPNHIRIKITDQRPNPNVPTRFKRKTIDALFNIPAVPDFPFLQSVKLQATSEGKFLIVQEIVSSQPLVLSPFTDTLFKNLTFHPDDYHEPIAGAAPDPAAQAMDIPMQDMPGGNSLTEKLRSAITVIDKTPKPKREKPEVQPLPTSLPASEVRDMPVHPAVPKPSAPKAPVEPVAPPPPTPGGSAIPPATP